MKTQRGFAIEERAGHGDGACLLCRLDGEIIGHVQVVEDGYLLFPGRKPVATREAAARQCLKRQTERNRKERLAIEAALAELDAKEATR